MENIIIATIKEWNIENYFKLKERLKSKYNFYLITDKEELNLENIKKINPKFIFFPHWSWIIKEDIYNSFDCIVFHMTDLPYGRGGSPFQNLIINEVYDTKISALKVDGGLDTGDIYLKEDFNINIGSAEENFIKLSNIIFEKMIPTLLSNDLVPRKQSGEIIEFKRRKPEESDIFNLKKKNLHKLYDFIRMLDAEGYPKAYIELDKIKIEFSEVHHKNKKLVGRFEVFENE
ncbi:methionyl-tRNA formyltransferase [Arcobacter sp. AHV-9/2010]|uniref:methionyl-tRNA formyltransferase n=1 Tax=Arcobacter sp. AHV-9/2010 TaxID=2021861 RepID=UPI00100BA6CC|nr:methionyl-tRNA formyltransferase [Arcobacter sp. CECT 9299]RXJ95490.1 methionyl-tRNA formyltransferase [Arcobacter sp. CECT 9299]